MRIKKEGLVINPSFFYALPPEFHLWLVVLFSCCCVFLCFRNGGISWLFFVSILDTAALGQSGADAEPGQDEFLQAEPSKDNNGQNQNVFHEIFFPICMMLSDKQYNSEYRSGMPCYL